MQSLGKNPTGIPFTGRLVFGYLRVTLLHGQRRLFPARRDSSYSSRNPRWCQPVEVSRGISKASIVRDSAPTRRHAAAAGSGSRMSWHRIVDRCGILGFFARSETPKCDVCRSSTARGRQGVASLIVEAEQALTAHCYANHDKSFPALRYRLARPHGRGRRKF